MPRSIAVFVLLLCACGGAMASSVASRDRLPTLVAAASRNGFVCDGRHYCGQMRSCEEANFFLSACGVRSLDGDNDGVPCENLCGHH